MKKNLKVKDEDFAKMKIVSSNRRKYVDKGLHFYFSYGIRLFLMILAIAIIGAISYACFVESFSEGKNVYMEYRKKADIDYTVTHIEQSLYEQGIINPVDGYLSEEVDKISTDINYYLELDESSKVIYSYRVDIEREVKNNKDGNYISNRVDTLIAEQKETVNNTKDLKIHQNVNLDYFNYNNDVKKLVSEAQLDVNSNLYLKMHVDIEVLNNKFDKEFKISDVVEVKIPLMSTNVTASMVDSIDKEDVYLEHTKSELVNEASLFVGIILLILDTLFILITISFVVKTTPKKSKYVNLRDGLLKSNGRVIVNTKRIPDFEGYNVIDCYSFAELLDAQRLLKKPILYKEIVRNQKCLFVVVSDNDIYQFVLKEADIEY